MDNDSGIKISMQFHVDQRLNAHIMNIISWKYALNYKGDIIRSCFISLGGKFSGITFGAICMGIIAFYLVEYNHTKCSDQFDNEDLNDYLICYQHKCNPYYNAISKCDNGNPTIY